MDIETSGIADKVREFFPVVSKCRLHGPDGLKTHYYGLFRMDCGKAIGSGSVSGTYTPHSSEDIVALCSAAEGVFGEMADVELTFRDGHYVSIAPTRQQRLAVFGTDTVWPRIIITARYGECFRASVGLYRDCCRNLHVMHSVQGTTVTFRHTSSLRSKMDDLIADFGCLRGGWDALSAQIRTMAQTQLDTADFLNRLYPLKPTASANAETRHRRRTEAIIRRVARERLAVGREPTDLGSATAWELWNAAGGYIQHQKPRRGFTTNFDRAVLAIEDADLRRAEALAMAV
jgi:hypothetical protein